MKLVRDHIDRQPWPDEDAKRHLGWVAPDSDAYRTLLRNKLIEEVGELLDADNLGDPDAVLGEAADVFEALRALLVAVYPGVTPSTARQVLANAVDRKFAERGGFFEGRTWTGPERENHPAPAAIRRESAQDASPVGGDTPEAPGGSQRVSAPGAETSGGWGWSGAQPDEHCPATAAHAAHAWSWLQAPTDRKWCDGSAMVAGTTVVTHPDPAGHDALCACGNAPTCQVGRPLPVVGSNVTIDRADVEDDCPHCSPTHGSPNRCAWGVRVDAEVDGDGQPIWLIVQPIDGAHVAQVDADWLYGLMRDHSGRPPLVTVVSDPGPADPDTQAQAERTWGHPLQYALVGRVTIMNSDHMSDGDIRAAAGPAGASGLPIERYNRCPTCEEWSPCHARPDRPGGEPAPAVAQQWTHGTRLGREHVSVRQHLIEDHGESPAEVARWSDGAVHGAHDGAHGRTWAYAENLPHPPAASTPGKNISECFRCAAADPANPCTRHAEGADHG